MICSLFVRVLNGGRGQCGKEERKKKGKEGSVKERGKEGEKESKDGKKEEGRKKEILNKDHRA